MIEITKLNGQNAGKYQLDRNRRETPDTVITLTSGKKIIVKRK